VDSSGVVILTYRSDTPADELAWRVSREPIREIGGPALTDVPLFNVVGVVRLSNEGIVIADAGNRLLRFFDGNGDSVATAGGDGEGPGQFRSIDFLGVFGRDSVVAFDYSQQRVSVFASSGQFVRTSRIVARDRLARVVAVSDDGNLVVVTPRTSDGPTGAGIHQDSAMYALYHPNGTMRQELGVMVWADGMVVEIGGGTFRDVPPFGRQTTVTLRQDDLHLSHQERVEIKSYSVS